MLNKTRYLTTFITFLALAGCQGPSGQTAAGAADSGSATKIGATARDHATGTSEMDGIFVGTVGVSAGASHFATAIVQDGRFMAWDPEGGHVYDGMLDINRNAFEGNIDTYAGAALAHGTRAGIDGVFGKRDYINAALRPPSGQAGQASLDYSNLHDRRALLLLLTDLWTRHDADSAQGTMLLIDDRGVLDGVDSEGCIYRGLVTVPDESQNIYKVSIGVQNCAELNGAYSGFATLRQDPQSRDRLTIVITDGAHAQVLQLDRGSAQPIIPAAAASAD